MIVQRESLENLDTWPSSGHSSDGHDLKQKEEQRSASLADKTGGHSSAKRHQAPGRTEKVWARWRGRGRGDGRLPRMGKPGLCQHLSPYSAHIQSCGPSPGPLACLPVPPPGLPLRPSGSLGLRIFWIRFASPGLSTVEPSREAAFSILVPGP